MLTQSTDHHLAQPAQSTMSNGLLMHCLYVSVQQVQWFNPVIGGSLMATIANFLPCFITDLLFRHCFLTKQILLYTMKTV